MACFSTLSRFSVSSVLRARLNTSRTVPSRTAISAKVVHSRRGTINCPSCNSAYRNNVLASRVCEGHQARGHRAILYLVADQLADEHRAGSTVALTTSDLRTL